MSDSGSLTPVPPSKPPAARSPAAEPPEIRVVDKRWWAQGEETQAEEPSVKPSYVEELERQLSEKDTLLQSYIAKYREAADEFEESRVRLRREAAKDVERGIRGILAELLEVVDNLDRAIDAARQTAPEDALVQGVEMVRDQFLAKLRGFGVTRLESQGQPFDPARHDAVTTVPVTEPAQDSQILGVIKEGYVIGDEVLRPASVAVGRLASPEGQESPPADSEPSRT